MKTGWWILAIAAGILAGCGEHPQLQSAPAAASSSEPARGANVVTIPPEIQASGGVKVTTIVEGATPEVIRATARLTNDENKTWRVGAVAEGRIVRVQANPGDVVKRDQLLAQMHSHDIHESRALYKRAKAEVDRLKGVEEYRVRMRDRAQRLLDLRAGSVAQLEQAETELRNAQTDVRNAEIEVERTRTHLVEVLGIPAEESEVETGPDGEDNDLIPVRSPAAGVVLTRNVTPGTVVNPANDLFTVSDLSSLWAIAEVNEEFLGKLRVGTIVPVYVHAYPNQPFQGRIGKLGEVLDPGTHTIKVRIELQNMRGLLKPEMYADAEIELGRGGSGLIVPVEAVQDLRGEPVVFAKTGADRFEVRPVRTGRTIGTNVEILSGLKSGDSVVTGSAFIVKSEYLKASLSGE